MGLFCNPCRQSACKCETVCQCNCNCTCECNNGTAGETTPEPRQIRAMLDYVLDSCCTTEDVSREITIECPSIFDPCELEVGSIIDVDIPGDISTRKQNGKRTTVSAFLLYVLLSRSASMGPLDMDAAASTSTKKSVLSAQLISAAPATPN